MNTASVVSFTTPTSLENHISEKNKAIAEKEDHIIEFYDSQVKVWETLIKENPNSSSISQWNKALDRSTTFLDNLKSELSLLQQELNDINIQRGTIDK